MSLFEKQCSEIFGESSFAEVLSSYECDSIHEIREIRIHPAYSGVYDAVNDVEHYLFLYSLAGLEQLSALEVLEITDYHSPADFTLSNQQLSQLRVFRVYGFFSRTKPPEILEDLSKMPNLEELSWLLQSPDDFNQILGLKKLTRLSLFANDIYDFSFLNQLPKTVEVDLNISSEQDELQEIIIGECNLVGLKIDANSQIDLANLNDLRCINLKNSTVNNSKHIETLVSLQELHLDAIPCLQFNRLDNCPQLSKLHIQNVSWDNPELTIRECCDLDLCINQTNLEKIFISQSSFKYQVNLSLNKLSQVSLQDVEIVRLDLNANELTTLDFLENILQKIEILRVSGSPISDLSPLQHCKNLKELSVGSSVTTSLEPLFALRDLRLGLSQQTIVPADHIKRLVEENNFEVICLSLDYLRQIDPLHPIRDRGLKKRLEHYCFFEGIAEECRNSMFIYRPLTSFKRFPELSDISVDKPIRSPGSLCKRADIKSLEGIGIFENLEEFTCNFKENEISLYPLLALKSLKYISICYAHINDLELLQEMSSLESCVFHGCTVPCLSEAYIFSELRSRGVRCKVSAKFGFGVLVDFFKGKKLLADPADIDRVKTKNQKK